MKSPKTDLVHRRSYYQRNREKVKALAHERYLQNITRIKQCEKNRYLAKRFGSTQARRVYGRRKHQKGRALTPAERVRNSRLRHLPETTLYRIRKIRAIGNRCACCGVSEWWNLTVDHIVPLTRGGTDDPTNLQILCHGCNTSKSAGERCQLLHNIVVPQDKR